jgi:hypothetical protein
MGEVGGRTGICWQRSAEFVDKGDKLMVSLFFDIDIDTEFFWYVTMLPKLEEENVSYMANKFC